MLAGGRHKHQDQATHILGLFAASVTARLEAIICCLPRHYRNERLHSAINLIFNYKGIVSQVEVSTSIKFFERVKRF
jgi:hypothetical protein